MSVVPETMIDDRLHVGLHGLRADGERAAGKLPKSGAGDGVVLDRAAIGRRVGTAEVELGAGLGQLEAENAVLHGVLRLGRAEEEALWAIGGEGGGGCAGRC